MLLRFRRKLSSLTGAKRGERALPAPGAKSFTEPFLGRSKAEALCTRECVLTGLWAKESSSRSGLPGSLLAAMEGRERVVWSEVLEPFSESLLVTVAFDAVESREGGGGRSGKAAEEGECSLDEGTETTTGEETAVPPGLRGTTPGLELVRFLEAEERLSGPSLGVSLAAPTDALMRLYRPLKPPWTSSMPFGSPAAAGAGGAVRSSKVVREAECEAVRCSWCSVWCSESRESLAMARGVRGERYSDGCEAADAVDVREGIRRGALAGSVRLRARADSWRGGGGREGGRGCGRRYRHRRAAGGLAREQQQQLAGHARGASDAG